MKIDSTVKVETRFVAAGAAVLFVLMQAVYLICGAWTWWVLAAGAWTTMLAVLNFLLLGVTLQKAISDDPENAKKRVKVSQSYRLLTLLILVGGIAWIGTATQVFESAEILALIIPLVFVRLILAVRGIIFQYREAHHSDTENTAKDIKKEDKDEK